MSFIPVYSFRGLLDVYPNQPGFTCVGITRQGRRCRQSCISRANLSEASRILDIMDHLDISDAGFMNRIQPRLQHLAELTLCPRWHRDDRHGNSQHLQTVSRWMSIVGTYRDQNHATTPTVTGSSSTRRRRSRVMSTITTSTPHSYLTPTATPQYWHSTASSNSQSPISSLSAHFINSSHHQNAHVHSHHVPHVVSTAGTTSSASNSSHGPTHIAPTIPIPSLGPSSQHLPSTPPAQFSTPGPSITSYNTVFTPENDSGYSSVHSAPSSVIGSDDTEIFNPASVFPSPSFSEWSMDPPSPIPSDAGSSIGSSRPASPALSSRSEPSSPSLLPTTPALHENISIIQSPLQQLETIPSGLTPSIPGTGHSSLGLPPAELQHSLSPNILPRQQPEITPSSPTSTLDTQHKLVPSLVTSLTLTLMLVLLLLEELLISITASITTLRNNISSLQLPRQAVSPVQVHPDASSAIYSSSGLPSHTQSQTPPPIIRRPLTDPCFTCYEPFADAADAVWCHSCGQNIHTECFEIWGEFRVLQGRPLECGFCRAVWV